MVDIQSTRTELVEKLERLRERAIEIENALRAPKSADSEERALELDDTQTEAAIGLITDAEMRDIRLAIDRIDSGIYSTCSTCGKTIAEERLTALPWTNKCAKCAELGSTA